MKWSLVPRNVAEAVDPPRVRREEITPLSPAQSRAFLAAAGGDRFEVVYVVALTCGLRQGEILGLKWSDVDLAAKTMRVNRQIQRQRNGGGLVFAEPKNASRRTVPLTGTAAEVLKRHGKRQAEVKMRIGSLYEDEGLLFASEIGTPWTRRTSSTARSSRCSRALACRASGFMTSGTPASRCCSPRASTPSSSRLSSVTRV